MATNLLACTGPIAGRTARSVAPLGFVLALLLLAGGIAGCDASEAADVAGETAPLAAAGVNLGTTPSQMRGIEELKSAWDAAWAAYDAEAYAANYTEDAEFANPVGGILSGREAIRETHVFLFSGPFAGSTQASELRRTVSLTGTIVMVDLNVTLTGYQSLPPGLPETEPGIVRTRVKWIAVKRGPSWEILAQQMTPLAPGTSF